MVKLAAEAASEVKPRYLVVLDLRGLCSFTDHFIIISADTDRQVRALADRVEERLAKTQARVLHHKEGYKEARWILLDYSDFVIHIFEEETRRYYDLEGLWADAPKRRL
ncbi:MAG: ribosome silencing factor [candidate division NC10 bacterium]|nr:ribosome silencing factor [candidate division NC10 bacterium]